MLQLLRAHVLRCADQHFLQRGQRFLSKPPLQRFRHAEVYNLGGGSRVELNDVLEAIQQVAGKGTKVVYRDVQRGDVKHTLADTSKAMGELAYRPQVDLRTGLQEQWEWLQETFS